MVKTFIPEGTPATTAAPTTWVARNLRSVMVAFQSLWTRVDALAFAAYGGARQSAASVAGTIDGTWRAFDMDELTLTPRGVAFTPTGGMQAAAQGVWSVNISFSVEHDEANSGRVIEVRISSALGGATAPMLVGVGRNVGVTTTAISTLWEITAEDVGETVLVEYRSDDAFSGVAYLRQSLSIANVGEWRG